MIFKLLFWACFGTLIYVFFGFVVVLWVVSKLKHRPVQKREIMPSVSMIICAFNEEKHIRQKIDNCLRVDYPKDRIEIIVVSDGSTDDTVRILKSLDDTVIRIHRTGERQGKTECQNLAAGMAKNDVLFFTDATVLHPPEALRLLLRSLHDPSVGCVTGKPVFNRDAGAASQGLSKREKYEFYLRGKLGEVGSLFGAQDCMYVVPRKLYIPVRADLDGGFVGPLQLLERGYRTAYEPEALAFVDRPAPDIRDELIRRSRIALRGMRGLFHMRRLMNPIEHGFVAVSLVSTRLLRWLTPVFLIMLFGSNLFLLGYPLFLFAFSFQVAFYVTAFAALLFARRGYQLAFPFYIPLYFCILVWSATVGLKRLLVGETGQMWETRR